MRASYSFDGYRNTQLSGFSRVLGFRDNQGFAYSGDSFNKTPLMAFEVNLIFNSYSNPGKIK